MSRQPWSACPAALRGRVEDLCGAHVVAAEDQLGGFSAGPAARLSLSDGRRVFVKAASPDPNPDTPAIHRREIAVTGSLPEILPVPRLLASHDDGDTVVLVLEDIDGRHPGEPWSDADLALVLAACDQLARHGTRCPVPGFPTAPEELARLFAGFDEDSSAPWGPGAAHRAELRALARQGIAVSAGDTLVHRDLRADNILIEHADHDDDGHDDGHPRVWFVDWPWAVRGAAWIDALSVVLNAATHGEPHPDRHLHRSQVLSDTDPEVIDAFLAGFAAYFHEQGNLPDPPGLPTVRQAQRRQGRAVLGWLARRRGWQD